MHDKPHEESPVTIAFAGGGTGGHLTPGMAVAEQLLDMDSRVELFFLGSGRPVEKHLLGRAGYALVDLRAVSTPQSIGQWLRFPFRLLNGWRDAKRVIAQREPDALVALGGYAALLPALVAARRGIPVIVLEQNSLPGRTNRIIAPRAAEIVVQWDITVERFAQPDRVSVLGNPVRREAMAIGREEACQRFGLSPEKTTLVVLGGSQGAVAVNELVFASLPRLTEFADTIQILHSVGDVGYDQAVAAYADTPIQVSFHRFVDDVGAQFGCADLAVSRSGATTLAELTANGIPSILIPYPYATDDHQFLNAKFLSDAGAAIAHRQSDLSPETFSDIMVDLLTDDDKRSAMAQAARSLGRPDAAEVVAERIMRHALERRRLRGAS